MEHIKKFKELIIKDKFVEAHEILEPFWLEYKKCNNHKKASFYKSLINGPTSIALILKKRSQRAQNITWEAFKRYENQIDIFSKNEKEQFLDVINLIEQKHNQILDLEDEI